jgi:hypothetical protein
MTMIVKGADKVRSLKRILVGELPKGAIEKCKTQLEGRVAKRFESRKAKHAEMSRLLKRSQEALIAQMLRDNPEIKQDMPGWSSVLKKHRKQTIAKPRSRLQLEPYVRSKSSLEFFENPPFDEQWFWPPLANQVDDANSEMAAEADSQTGTYNLNLYSDGAGSQACAAGVGIIFPPLAETTMQKFVAVGTYNNVWGDNANFYTADVDLQTHLGVWGVMENAWVTETNVGPSVNSHVGC